MIVLPPLAVAAEAAVPTTSNQGFKDPALIINNTENSMSHVNMYLR